MKSLTPNMEMYLKTIYEIASDGGEPRVKLIAKRLGVTMPSVTGAIENLQTKKLVEHTPYGDVRLTTKGRRVARQVKDRHELIYRFLLNVLKLPEATASRDACVLEHVVSPRTFERMSSFLQFTEKHPDQSAQLIDQFADWIDESETSRK
jgi:DtxR family Mn-dependent transcriptional regulator